MFLFVSGITKSDTVAEVCTVLGALQFTMCSGHVSELTLSTAIKKMRSRVRRKPTAADCGSLVSALWIRFISRGIMNHRPCSVLWHVAASIEIIKCG